MERLERLPRIAVLCGMAGLGGAELSLLELVWRLRGRLEFHLIVPSEGLLQARAREAGATVWILPWPKDLARAGETSGLPNPTKFLTSAARLRPFTRQLEGLLDEIGAAALITNSLKAHVVGALARRPEPVPLIWYMRDGLEGRSLSRKILAFLSKRCDLAVCISRYVEREVKRYVSRSLRTKVIYNIVDLELFRPGNAVPEDLRKQPGEVWFGTVGAITPLKGLDVFLDAGDLIAEELPEARFLIVGSNPYVTQVGSDYEGQLRKRVAGSRLREQVKFLGFREDVHRIFSQLDVLVQPNRGPEGLGRSVLEAMACSVPVIAVNRWGPAELVKDGITGLLFQTLDAKSLANQMLKLGTDSALRARLGTNANEWIRENLTPEELAGEFERTVLDLIAQPQGQAASA
jgi:glycosyltransferase involved in cell wall biosynthesis